MTCDVPRDDEYGVADLAVTLDGENGYGKKARASVDPKGHADIPQTREDGPMVDSGACRADWPWAVVPRFLVSHLKAVYTAPWRTLPARRDSPTSQPEPT